MGGDAAHEPGRDLRALPGGGARAWPPGARGPIITVASTAGQRGEPHYSHYAASKGALVAFTKSLAAELAPTGHPRERGGPRLGRDGHDPRGAPAPDAALALRKIPLGRPGRPEEIAGPVAFLASDLASYLYGEILSVNGGAVMAV